MKNNFFVDIFSELFNFAFVAGFCALFVWIW